MKRHLIFLAMALAASSANAIMRRHDIDDSVYQGFGTSFASVGRVNVNGGWTGSGTLIRSNWIVTAAHVIDNGTGFASFDINGQTYDVAEYFVNPNWNGDLLAGNDITVARLTSDVAGVTPTDIYTGNSEVGSTVEVIGYGGAGDGVNGWNGSYDLIKRGGTNTVDAKDFSLQGLDFVNTLIMDFDSPAGDRNALAALGSGSVASQLEMNVMFGDSGGALMLNGQLAGVTSFIWDPVYGGNWGVYGWVSGFTGVAKHSAWINSVVPEPTSMLGLALVLPMIAKRRRKR